MSSLDVHVGEKNDGPIDSHDSASLRCRKHIAKFAVSGNPSGAVAYFKTGAEDFDNGRRASRVDKFARIQHAKKTRRIQRCCMGALMIPNNNPAALVGASGANKTTLSFLDYNACGHGRVRLVKLECGAGGVQYRKYCMTCWGALGGAIAHSEAHAQEARSGIEAPLATLEIIHAARDCYARRARPGEAP